MLTRIALISQPDPALRDVRSLLRNPMKYAVREFCSMEEINQGLKEFPFEVLLMRLSLFTLDHVQIVEKARARFPDVSLITSVGKIDPSARFQVKKVNRHKLISERSELKDLPRIIDVLRQGDMSSLRLHPRSERIGNAEIIDAESGMRLKAKFVDFAQMGARLLVHSKERLKKNSRIQLQYHSSVEAGKIQKIESLIVWETYSGGLVESIVNGPQQMLGLRFIAAL